MMKSVCSQKEGWCPNHGWQGDCPVDGGDCVGHDEGWDNYGR